MARCLSGKNNLPVPDYAIPSVETLAFPVWHQVKFNTPDVQTLSAQDTVDIAHAAPARSTRTKDSIPARFDPVLVETASNGVAGEGSDIRVAHLRVIFELPEDVQIDIFDRLKLPRPGKLAYVEWFSKLGDVDDVTGMYSVRRAMAGSGHAARRAASVVESVDIRRSCHLVAKLNDGMLSTVKTKPRPRGK